MNKLKINITKSWRKSISMKFDRNGVLQVRAPKFMLSSQIQNFLDKNNAWIEKQQNKIIERKEHKKWYLFGEEIPLSGILSLNGRKGSNIVASSLSSGEGINPPLFDHDSVPLNKGEYETQGSRGIVESFFKSQAKSYIIPRCEELAEKYGFEFESIRITSAMTRWGSCSSKKTLNFSYRLIMAPRECIDYVIIHELCHLRQMNHSKKFWSEVEKIMPEYKSCEKHLKEFGWRYTL